MMIATGEMVNPHSPFSAFSVSYYAVNTSFPVPFPILTQKGRIKQKRLCEQHKVFQFMFLVRTRYFVSIRVDFYWLNASAKSARAMPKSVLFAGK